VVHEQAAGFALDALDRDEAIAFEHHLAVCPGCEDALEPLRLAAAALAFAGELPAPRPELRRRVVAMDAVVLPFRRRATPLLSGAALAAAACLAVVFALHDGGRAPVGDTQAFRLHGAEGSLLVAPSGEAVLAVRRLRAAPAGKTYEVWVVQRGRPPVAAGFLHGSISELTRDVPRRARVVVTVEPAGGSRAPTGPLLLRAERA
jgi:anti-sigma-K factor RskA